LKFYLWEKLAYTALQHVTNQEQTMNTAATSYTYDEAAASTSYVSNVASAARGFFAALFAVKQDAANDKTALYLTRMADDYEHIAPSLSAELRVIATRN